MENRTHIAGIESPGPDINTVRNKTIAKNKPVRPGHIIEIDNLGKGFENDPVLKNLSLKLYNGENLVVLGKSGSGKSVLIKCIVGLLHPDQGTIKVFGQDVNELTGQGLAEIMININSGEGALGRLIQDSTIAENINQTIANFKKSSEGMDETIEITKVNVFEFMEKLQLTVATTETATVALGEIMVKINSGEGTLGMLIQDTTMSENFNQTLINLEQSSAKFDENMEALKHSIFFRRYFRRKAEQEEQERIDAESENAVERLLIDEE